MSGTDLHRLSQRMRSDWDRRIEQDYRYWMGDGADDDASMWKTGARDFALLFEGFDPSLAKTCRALELGCGVGRLLRPAASFFANVTGVDVSPAAIRHAQKLLRDLSNVQLVLGNGADLSPIPTNSQDVVFSFACLSNMPSAAFASYLSEIARVVKPGGTVRLQLFLGEALDTHAEDTLTMRSFARKHLEDAVKAAGFVLESAWELVLPFEVSDREQGYTAEIVSLKRTGAPLRVTNDQIANLLTPEVEPSLGNRWPGSRTEYLMAVARASQHLEAGRRGEALRALEYAVMHYAEAEAEILEVLAALRGDANNAANASEQLAAVAARSNSASHNTATARSVEEARPSSSAAVGSVTTPGTSDGAVSAPASLVLGSDFRPERLARNLQLISDRFPEVAPQLERLRLPGTIGIKHSSEGPVVTLSGMPLDNPDAPRRAAQVWAESVLRNPSVAKAEHLLLVGFASGYHIEALHSLSKKQLHVIEPRPEVVGAALGVRDCQHAISSIASLNFGVQSLESIISGRQGRVELVIHPQTQALSASFVDECRRVVNGRRAAQTLRPSFAVVGPIYGGTLPIAGHAARALQRMNHRVRSFDLSSYKQNYFDVFGLFKSTHRAGVIQTQMVELLSQIVLEGVNERPVDILICLAQAPMSPRVLTELRERGVITVMWFVEDYRRFTTWKEISRYYDYMFVIQKGDAIRSVEQAGAGKAIYLPMCCDPETHRPLILTPEERERFGSELSFVGAGYNNRRQMFATLARRNFKIWGTEWPAMPPFTHLVQDSGARIDTNDYVKVFNASAINLNLHSSMERDGVEPYGDFINPRTYELAACEAFQLVDNRTLLPDQFEIGSELITFADRRELDEGIEYYLAHPEERRRIALASRLRVLREHTYQHRLETMLSYIYADRFEQLQSRAEQGPWPATLEAAKSFPELEQRFQAVFERGDEPTLESLISDIKTGNGSLSDLELKLLFLHHVRAQISYVNDLRAGKAQ